MMLVAPSGLGKSTLVAKFAMTYVLKSAVPFPFIYFNFGTASSRPRRSLDLLVEAARQLSLQFPDYCRSFTNLKGRVSDWIAEGDDVGHRSKKSGDDSALQGSSETFFVSFRDQLQATSRWSDRTVMVFDALETIQSSPDAMSDLKEFLRLLCANGFPQLRLLFAGRAEVAEFRDEPWLDMVKKPLTLGPLGIAEACEMVNRLGALLLRDNWRPSWANKIAGCSNDPPGRREPLALRVGVERICSASKEQRDKVVGDYAESWALAAGSVSNDRCKR
ncbi:hypothetical protein IHQ71_29225 (plasmid) [Rhizobium sp. TH2]|uniref:hypothetical protein n=1 Tax=Rhizobium sp. TH2 TaxID=2775403 RepID=UPI0021577AE6|nr:hypothetical protein [Rhizobium sp. TH2]UVC12310.1 hypothetical protein IHQ71_29225 [Rhizobium sp. TH2]